MTTLHWATFAELDAATLYRLLRLRSEVFVVEQACPYPDLDGRDLEASTRFAWIEVDGEVVAALRVLDDGAALRIGRVATGATHRGQGLAAALLQAALARTTGPVVLDAQSYLQAFYEGYGFVVTGGEFLEDGIPHVPMRLDR